MNLEKTQSKTLVILLGSAMCVWTQVKYKQLQSGWHQHAPNISNSSWVCATTTTALSAIMQSSQCKATCLTGLVLAWYVAELLCCAPCMHTHTCMVQHSGAV